MARHGDSPARRPRLISAALIAITGLVAAAGLAIANTAHSAPPSEEPVAATATQSPGLVDCEVDFESEYAFGTGSIFKITITAGDEPVQGWTVSWFFPDDSQITRVFDVHFYDQTDRLVRHKNHPMWGYINPGESTSSAFLVDTPWMSQVPAYSAYCKDSPW